MSSRLPVILVLGTTQAIGWASSYYLPAIIADPVGAELGGGATPVFAAFSAALLLSAFLGPRIGRFIDAVGGRGVLSVSNLVFAAGLTLLGLAPSQPVMWVAYLVIGVGMALGLYDTAFATLGRLYGASARGSITGITLIAGFASTIGWPLSAWGLEAFGWREVCFGWAAINIALCLPLNRFLLPVAPPHPPHIERPAGKPHIPFDRNMILLSIAFALAWMVTGAMSAHLPRLLQATGLSAGDAIAAGALVGPAQIVARITEIGFLSRFHPLLSARLSAIGTPIGAAFLALFGPGGAFAFAIAYGAGNGILTIARGTVPLAVFGPANYGYRLGLLGAASRFAQAGAPLLFGLLIDWSATAAVAAAVVASLGALAALTMVRPRAKPA